MADDRKKQPGAIRVLVADNSRFHTQLLVGVLSRVSDLQIFSSELELASLVSAAITQKIDVLVLSAFADEDAQRGFRILEELRKTHPSTRGVILLDSSKPESILEAFRVGAKGVFDHQESSDMLCQCIRQVHAGQVWINNEQVALVLDALAAAPKVRAVTGNGMNLLSKREADVVGCLAEGLTNREIADRLGLSQHTIKNHLFRIFDKLGVSNRIELLFMTLSNITDPPVLLQGVLAEPDGNYDAPTLEFCEKAAEKGALAAQLLLARIAWSGRASDSDPISAYLWYSVALDQLTRTRSTVKRTMNAAQLAEAERRVRERLSKSLQRIEPAHSGRTSSDYKHSIVA